jgi:hypothetical protein
MRPASRKRAQAHWTIVQSALERTAEPSWPRFSGA